jgi:uncharacterized protein YcnI
MRFAALQNFLVGGLLSLAAVPVALAHVTLEASEAPANSFHRAVFRIPHGCEGSPTVAIRVRIPDGVTGVKPQPKPGWTVSIEESNLGPSRQALDGEKTAEIVKEVSWSGGNLPDGRYDEFAMEMRLPPASGTVLVFPVIQQCEIGVNRWIERPHAGHQGHGDARGARRPAPQLRVR